VLFGNQRYTPTIAGANVERRPQACGLQTWGVVLFGRARGQRRRRAGLAGALLHVDQIYFSATFHDHIAGLLVRRAGANPFRRDRHVPRDRNAFALGRDRHRVAAVETARDFRDCPEPPEGLVAGGAIASGRPKPGTQPTLFELKENCRPESEWTAAARYREPNLFSS
jgi:hypothetical protein